MKPLHYVILWHHDIAEPHYDLMFETSAASDLATWRSTLWPIESPTSLIRLRDHRRAFLNYEGQLTGQRGSVQRIATGECEVQIGEDAVWKIKLLNGSPPTTLAIRQIEGEHWSADQP
jgi:hypothetical protein